MCGRYLRYAPVERLERAVTLDLGSQRANLEQRYNIAPIISATDGKRLLNVAHWGLVLLCANGHRTNRRRTPWLPVRELTPAVIARTSAHL